VIRRSEAEAVLDVGHRPTTIACEHLEFTSVRPDRWTIVEHPGPYAGLAALWGASYGVCPSCSYRAPLSHPVVEARCSKCGGTFSIDWPASRSAAGSGRDS
jgi:hypothetical protein